MNVSTSIVFHSIDRQGRDQVVELEHKADGRRAVVGELVVGQRADIPAVHGDGSFGRAVESAEQFEQCAFAGSRGAENDDEFTLIQ